MTVPVCSGHLPPADTGHRGPQPASLSQYVYSDKCLCRANHSNQRELPCLRDPAKTSTTRGDQSSNQNPVSSCTIESDPGKTTERILIVTRHFTLSICCVHCILSCVLQFSDVKAYTPIQYKDFVSFRLTAHSWTPSMRPTSAALLAAPAASPDDSSPSVCTSCPQLRGSFSDFMWMCYFLYPPAPIKRILTVSLKDCQICRPDDLHCKTLWLKS